MQAVSQTALWTAASRAWEHKRSNRLFEDPYAEALAGEEGFYRMDALLKARGQVVREDSFIPVRTRFYDDFLLDAVKGGVRQIVLPGAGMDTRAYRMPWPEGTELFELDMPEAQEYKTKILDRQAAPGCKVHRISADLREPWREKLLGAGFTPSLPSAWVAEGLFVYLEETEVHSLLKDIASLSSHGSFFGADFVNEALFTSPDTKSWVDALADEGHPFRFPCDLPEQLLGEYGWSVRVVQIGEEGANYGRWPAPALSRGVPGIPDCLFAQAVWNE